jgi:ferredoxin
VQACRRCIDDCPAEALRFIPTEDGDRLLALDACHGCGLCVSRCDSEALSNPDLDRLNNEVEHMAASGRSDSLDLTCHRLSNGPALHCLHGLPGDLLLDWRARHPHLQIRLHWPQHCGDCPAAPRPETPRSLPAMSQALSELNLSAPSEQVSTSPRRDFSSHAGQRLGRRQLLSALREPERPTTPDHGVAPLRPQRLRRALARLYGTATAEQLAPVPALQLDSSRCDAHGQCSRVCPSQALGTDAAGDLHFNAEHCLGCGSCVTHCPNQALRLETHPQRPAAVFAQVLRRGAQAHCFTCGHVFTHNPTHAESSESVCPACRRDPVRVSGRFDAWFD